jgi:hypothetical protein
MGDYPYCKVISKLTTFLSDIQKEGVPDKLTVTQLERKGLKSSNDRQILLVLKAIGFTDQNGVPTQLYKDYKVTQRARGAMASALKTAYSDLFAMYPNAQEQPDEKLRDFFAGEMPKKSHQMLQVTVTTFRALSALADFDLPAPGAVAQVEVSGLPAETAAPAAGETARRADIPLAAASAAGAEIHIDVQVHIPAGAKPDEYDAIFAAIAKHLLNGTAEQ